MKHVDEVAFTALTLSSFSEGYFHFLPYLLTDNILSIVVSKLYVIRWNRFIRRYIERICVPTQVM